MFCFSKLCRLCLEQNRTLINYNNPDVDNVSFVEKLTTLMPTLVNEENNFPKWICDECQESLRHAHRFQKKCFETHQKLTNYAKKLEIHNGARNNVLKLELTDINFLDLSSFFNTNCKPILSKTIKQEFDEHLLSLRANTESNFLLSEISSILNSENIKEERNLPLIKESSINNIVNSIKKSEILEDNLLDEILNVTNTDLLNNIINTESETKLFKQERNSNYENNISNENNLFNTTHKDITKEETCILSLVKNLDNANIDNYIGNNETDTSISRLFHNSNTNKSTDTLQNTNTKIVDNEPLNNESNRKIEEFGNTRRRTEDTGPCYNYSSSESDANDSDKDSDYVPEEDEEEENLSDNESPNILAGNTNSVASTTNVQPIFPNYNYINQGKNIRDDMVSRPLLEIGPLGHMHNKIVSRSHEKANSSQLAFNYACNICGTKFISSSECDNHKRIHPPNALAKTTNVRRKYVCKICGIKHKSHIEYEQHKQSHHSNNENVTVPNTRCISNDMITNPDSINTGNSSRTNVSNNIIIQNICMSYNHSVNNIPNVQMIRHKNNPNFQFDNSSVLPPMYNSRTNFANMANNRQISETLFVNNLSNQNRSVISANNNMQMIRHKNNPDFQFDNSSVLPPMYNSRMNFPNMANNRQISETLLVNNLSNQNRSVISSNNNIQNLYNCRQSALLNQNRTSNIYNNSACNVRNLSIQNNNMYNFLFSELPRSRVNETSINQSWTTDNENRFAVHPLTNQNTTVIGDDNNVQNPENCAKIINNYNGTQSSSNFINSEPSKSAMSVNQSTVNNTSDLDADDDDDEAKPFKCLYCSNSFSRYRAFRNHINAMHKSLLKCIKCDRILETYGKLLSHKCVQTNTEKMCDKCGKIFKNYAKLDNHILQVHTIGEYLCNVCGKKFISRCRLNMHIRYSHKDKNKEYKCSICSKIYSKMACLSQHKRIHSNERHSCQFCNKTFQLKAILKIHLRTHTGEQPYVCKICGKSFTQSYSLVVHTRVHTNNKPFQCKECGKSYTQSYVYTQHMKKKHPNSAETTLKED